MKKLFSLFILVFTLVLLVSCGNKPKLTVENIRIAAGDTQKIEYTLSSSELVEETYTVTKGSDVISIKAGKVTGLAEGTADVTLTVKSLSSKNSFEVSAKFTVTVYVDTTKSVVKNGSFEDGTTGWNVVSADGATIGTAVASSDKVVDGTVALVLWHDLDGDGTGDAIDIECTQTVTLYNSQKYLLSFYYYGNTENIVVTIRNKDGYMIATETFAGTGYKTNREDGYKNYGLEYTANGTEEVTISIHAFANFENPYGMIDLVTMKPGSVDDLEKYFADPRDAKNLFTNNFSELDLNWTIIGGNQWSTDNGPHYAVWQSGSVDFKAYQDVTVEAGTYKLEIDYNGQENPTRCRIVIIDLQGHYVTTEDLVPVGWGTGAYKTASLEVTLEAGTYKIGVEVNGTAGYWVNLTNFYFYAK